MLRYSVTICALLVAFVSLASAQDTTWFRNNSDLTGITGRTAIRIWTVDLDNDDYPDIVTEGELYSLNKKLRIYLNKQQSGSTDPRDRVFVDVTASSGVDSSRIASQNTDTTGRQIDIVSFADVNNDGFTDIVTGCYWHRLELGLFKDDPMEVMLNDGTGHFTIVPKNGLFELGQINTTGLSWLDMNLDGKLDLFIGTWSDDHTNNIFHGDIMMQGNGDGTFKNITFFTGIDTVPFPLYGCSAFDWNNDGWTDVATSPYCRSSGKLWKNNGDGTFSDAQAGYNAQTLGGDNAQPLCQWSAMPADFDNDGDLDVLQVLVHGGIDAGEGRSVIAMNGGASNGYKLQWDLSRLVRKTPQSTHLGDEGAVWTDIDNDGLLDVVMTECCYLPNTDRTFFFRQDSTHKLTDVTQKLGFLSMLRLTTRVAQFDYDLDGDEDLLVQTAQKPVRDSLGNVLRKVGTTTDSTKNSNEYYLLRNDIGNKNNWVSVKLIPPSDCNRNAIGSRITVYSGGVAQIREVNVGRGHFAEQSPLIQNIGLGKNTSIDSIVVRWANRSQQRTVVANPPINQLLRITSNGIGGIKDKSQNEISCTTYPNPAASYVNVTVPEAFTRKAQLMVFDAIGRIVYTTTISDGTGTVSVPVGSLASGCYCVRISTAEGKSATAKFVRLSN